MKPPHVVVLTVTVIVAVLLVTASYYYLVVSAPANSVTVTITANDGPQGDTVGFLPANFTVKEGQHVTLALVNGGSAPHELRIGVFGADTGIVNAGATKKVSFIPNKVGTFIAAEPCGAGPPPPRPLGCNTEGYVTVLSP
jgi:uncharacterized cupredoxin-like copper-binding protein